MEQTALTLTLIILFVAVAWVSYVLGGIVTMRRMSSSFAREIFMTINTIKALAEAGSKTAADEKAKVEERLKKETGVDMHV